MHGTAQDAPRKDHVGTEMPNVGPRWAQEPMMLDLGSPVDHNMAPEICKISFKIPS